MPRKRGRIVAAITLGLILFGLILLWTQRKPITRGMVDRELARRGVPARYEIADLGFSVQRLENVVIGDPAAPDLTARWAEIRLRPSTSGVRLTSVVARGVRLKGRLIDGKVSLGAIDRLMPPPSGAPFTLPNMRVDLADARMRLDTPAGRVGIALDGRGNLTDGFGGKLAAVAPMLAMRDCSGRMVTAYVTITIRDRKPAFDGPVRADRVACPGFQLERPQLAADISMAEALDRWDGEARIASGPATLGPHRAGGLGGRIAFAGDAKATRGKADVTFSAVRATGVAIRQATVAGDYALRSPAGTLNFAGKVGLQDAVLPPATAASLRSALASGEGTPFGPLGRALGDAVVRAGRETDVQAALTLAQGPRGGLLRLADLDAASRSGMRLTISGGDGVAFAWPEAKLRVDGAVALAGGGFPSARITLRPAPNGGGMSGSAEVSPYAAGGARLALAPVRFAAAGGVTRFATTMTLDGPLADGRITGLTLPLDGRLGPGGALAINERCVPLDFAALEIAGMRLGRSRVPLCPAGGALLARSSGGTLRGGGVIASPRLTGRSGDAPITIAARSLRFGVANADFVSDALAIRLGAPPPVTRLDIARLDGAFRTGGITGRFAGLGGQIGNVPLVMSDGSGTWRLTGGRLAADGRLGVADAAADPRFQPMISNDVHLTLVDGVVRATGTLLEPQTNTAVSDVALTHTLATGRGGATLDVVGITFGDALQPEALTRLTLGVVANVQGSLAGRGEIRWDPDGVTSTGTFRTDKLDFAAAFGPVKTLKGEIRFTDLLGLETAPGETATIAEINAGIAISDGVVRYQLLPGQRVRIEEGRWPFSGGQLVLQETILDFSQPSARHLTFRVEGMDAALFIEQFGFKNIAATGIFDGALPLVFDEHGGRIVNGRLVVRPGGGTLAYVGEVSNADLGMFAKLAFDALKSLRYDNLAIDLDGALDGEIVSKVVLLGVNDAPADGAESTGLLKQLTGLPFKFNITIKAPFRSLINSAQSLTDPRGLISQALPPDAELPGSVPPVQPK